MNLGHKLFGVFVITIVVGVSLVSEGNIKAQSTDEISEVYNWLTVEGTNPSDPIYEIGDIVFNYLDCDTNNDGVRDNEASRCDDSEEAILNQYQVKVNFTSDTPTRQTLSGYAWNPKLGKITFNPGELSGCPSGLCRAYINEEDDTLNGWAKVIEALDWKYPRFGPEYNDTTNGEGDYQHQGLDVHGDYLYLGGAKLSSTYNSFFSIFDVADPENPIMKSHTDLTINGTSCVSNCDSTNVRYFEWNGYKLVFISQYKFGYFVYEVSDPENPVLMGYKSFNYDSTETWETAVYGNRAFIGGYFYGELPGTCPSGKPGLAYFDLTQLTSNPSSELSFSYPSNSCSSTVWQDVAVYDNYLISSQRADGIKVYDLTLPDNPFLLQTYSSGFNSEAWAYGIFIYDNYLYIANLNPSGNGNGFITIPLVTGPSILDTANAVSTIVSTPNPPGHSRSRSVYVKVSNDVKYAYIGSDVGGVNIYDVTAPSSIIKTGQFVSIYNTSLYNGQTFELAYTNGALFAGIDLGSGSLKAFSLLKADIEDQWIHFVDPVSLSPLSYNPNSNYISGDASGGTIMGTLNSSDDSAEQLYISRQPAVTLNVNPNPEDSGYTREINWSVSENAVRCYSAGGNASWTNTWDFDVDTPPYSGNLIIGPVNEISPDNVIRLICENSKGKIGEKSKEVGVNGLDPQLAPRCGSASGRSFALTPRNNLCEQGTESSVILENGFWKWSCSEPGYETKNCTASKSRINVIDF